MIIIMNNIIIVFLISTRLGCYMRTDGGKIILDTCGNGNAIIVSSKTLSTATRWSIFGLFDKQYILILLLLFYRVIVLGVVSIAYDGGGRPK